MQMLDLGVHCNLKECNQLDCKSHPLLFLVSSLIEYVHTSLAFQMSMLSSAVLLKPLETRVAFLRRL